MIAAYAVVLVSVTGYGLHLRRECASLRKSLSGGEKSNRG